MSGSGSGPEREEKIDPPPSYRELLLSFLKISLLGFGGPNAHLALMLDEVVERKGWVDREHFLHLIGVTNLLPGPNSSEVSIHIGYIQRGWKGALVTGLAFLVPTFLFVVILSGLYFEYGTLPQAELLFWGLKPVIVAIILWAGWRLGREAVDRRRLAGLALVGLVVTLGFGRWAVAAMATGGFLTWLEHRLVSRGADEGADDAGARDSGAGGVGRGDPGWEDADEGDTGVANSRDRDEDIRDTRAADSGMADSGTGGAGGTGGNDASAGDSGASGDSGDSGDADDWGDSDDSDDSGDSGDSDDSGDAADGSGGGEPASGRWSLLPLVPLGVAGVTGAGALLQVFWLHLWIGSVLFGGGYVLVALLEPYAVGSYGWLTQAQFLDGVALTQAVPGPISTLSAFVGYAAAGPVGALLGTAGIYIPAFAGVLLVAPHLERIRQLAAARAALAGVSAVVAGAILGVGVSLIPAAVPGWGAAVLFTGALVARGIFAVPAPWLVLGGVGAGLGRLLLG